jgi:hypothetical protein
MKLDSTLSREIKALNGDGTREARFETLRRVKAAQGDLSTPNVREEFGRALQLHGRAVVALCVAATLYTRRERIDGWGLLWALTVLDLWTNRGPQFIDRANIDDGLHPTRICEYAGELIRLTTEEG